MKNAASEENIKISDAILATLLSLLLPGVGQCFQRRWLVGALFLFAAAMWDILFMPIGWCVHLWSVIDALLYGLMRR